jgi:tellurite resistance protein TerC
MPDEFLVWIGFSAFLLAMLALDLGIFHRKSHTVSLKEALTWSAIWIGLALAFNIVSLSSKPKAEGLSAD